MNLFGQDLWTTKVQRIDPDILIVAKTVTLCIPEVSEWLDSCDSSQVARCIDQMLGKGQGKES